MCGAGKENARNDRFRFDFLGYFLWQDKKWTKQIPERLLQNTRTSSINNEEDYFPFHDPLHSPLTIHHSRSPFASRFRYNPARCPQSYYRPQCGAGKRNARSDRVSFDFWVTFCVKTKSDKTNPWTTTSKHRTSSINNEEDYFLFHDPSIHHWPLTIHHWRSLLTSPSDLHVYCLTTPTFPPQYLPNTKGIPRYNDTGILPVILRSYFAGTSLNREIAVCGNRLQV